MNTFPNGFVSAEDFLVCVWCTKVEHCHEYYFHQCFPTGVEEMPGPCRAKYLNTPPDEKAINELLAECRKSKESE